MKNPSLILALLASNALMFAPAFASTAPKQQATPTVISAKGPLGDLHQFRSIAQNTLALVKTGKLADATKRVKDLEIAWDVAQPKLQPMNTKTWREVDIAIDRVLNELRADKPQVGSSTHALENLIKLLDSLKQ